MKLSFQFSSLGHFVKKLEQTGVNGVALFNRFYQPDINLNNLEFFPSLQLSTSEESLIAMHWIAILYGRLKISLAATGGIHTAEDVLKLMLAGADVTYMCSILLKNGAKQIAIILRELEKWLTENEYASINQLKGSMSQLNIPNPAKLERLNYIKLLESYGKPSLMNI